jgi:hypothetical protein
MKWIKWLCLLPLFLLKNVVVFVIAAPVVVFFSTPDKLYLRSPFNWMNSRNPREMTGDGGWQREHLWYGTDPMHTINRIGWIFRNGGQELAYTAFGCSVDDPHPFFRPLIPIWGTKRLDLIFGWNMPGAVNGRAKFNFTIRIKDTATEDRPTFSTDDWRPR